MGLKETIRRIDASSNQEMRVFTRKTNFVRFIIKLGKISMDPKKIKAIVSWQELENVI